MPLALPAQPTYTRRGLVAGVLSSVFDLGPVRRRGVDRAVAVAGQVDGLVDFLLVVFAVPAQHERDLDLLEGPRPLLLLLALHLDRQRFEGLLELLQQQDDVDAGAAAERGHEHLGRAHRLVVAEDWRVVDAYGVAGLGQDVELDLVPGPCRRRFCHGANDSRKPRNGAPNRVVYSWRHVGGSSHSRWSRQDGGDARDRSGPSPARTPLLGTLSSGGSRDEEHPGFDPADRAHRRGAAAGQRTRNLVRRQRRAGVISIAGFGRRGSNGGRVRSFVFSDRLGTPSLPPGGGGGGGGRPRGPRG